MTEQQAALLIALAARIADQLESIAESLKSVITVVNEGEPDEERAIQTWEARD